MKVSELTGAMLDYWVAKALGLPLSCDANQGDYILVGTGAGDLERFSPHEDWSEGGPIIEDERIDLGPHNAGWLAYAQLDQGNAKEGPTPLIAAMRCVVARKFGDEVPNEPK